MNAVIPANCIFIVFIVFILYLFLIYWKSYLFLFIVNQYMYSKLYKFSFEGKACYIKLFTNMYWYLLLYVCELTADGSICIDLLIQMTAYEVQL